MKKIFSLLTGLPAAIIMIAFAIANRGDVRVSFDPVSPATPWYSIDVPLWMVVFAAVFAGLLIGWILAWINQGKWRKAARNTASSLKQEQAKSSGLQKLIKSVDLVPAHKS